MKVVNLVNGGSMIALMQVHDHLESTEELRTDQVIADTDVALAF